MSDMHNLLSHDMDYIARHYNIDLGLPARLACAVSLSHLRPHDPSVTAWHFWGDAVRARDVWQVWALRLEGKTDQEKLFLTSV